MFDVNVYGVLRMTRAFVPHMRQQQAGRVITIGSLAGKLVLPLNGTYSVTKFAMEALSDAMRVELAPFGMEAGAHRTREYPQQFHGHGSSQLAEYPLSP